MTIYDKNTIEFVTVALEFCAMVEAVPRHTLFSFADKSVKILPLLYLKATLLPTVDDASNDDTANFITEETYESVRRRIADMLGDNDLFLETFHPDIQYSDAPIVSTISENIADVYQDIGDFVALFRQENEAVMTQALYVCKENFRQYWGQKLLNALKAIHAVRFAQDYEPDSAITDNEFYLTDDK